MRHLHSLLEDTVDTVTTHDVATDHFAAELATTMLDTAPPGTMTFRAETVDQALADATAEIGRDVEILEANRIRRGGVGGFFATDLGVEIVVAPVSRSARADERLGVPSREMPESFTPPPSAPSRTRRPSSSAFDLRAAAPQKPQFYDRVIEEAADDRGDAAPAAASARPPARPDRPKAIDARESAPRTEVAASVDPTLGSITAQIDSESFASHFAREMAIDAGHDVGHGTARRRSILDDDGELHDEYRSTSLATPIEELEAARPVELVEPVQVTDDGPLVDRVPSRPRPRRVTTRLPRSRQQTAPSTDDAEAAHVERTDVVEDTVTEPIDETAQMVEETTRTVETTTRTVEESPAEPPRAHAIDRPTDVLTGAVNTLVEQLSATAPVDGSRLNDLKRLRLKVTTKDGDVVEMTAELGAK